MAGRSPDPKSTGAPPAAAPGNSWPAFRRNRRSGQAGSAGFAPPLPGGEWRLRRHASGGSIWGKRKEGRGARGGLVPEARPASAQAGCSFRSPAGRTGRRFPKGRVRRCGTCRNPLRSAGPGRGVRAASAGLSVPPRSAGGGDTGGERCRRSRNPRSAPPGGGFEGRGPKVAPALSPPRGPSRPDGERGRAVRDLQACPFPLPVPASSFAVSRRRAPRSGGCARG